MAAKKKVAKRKTPGKLSDLQRRAIDAYEARGFRNKCASLREAGYADTTAQGNPHGVFNNPNVRREIEKRLDALRRKYVIDEDFVMQRFARIANGPEIMARFRMVAEDGSLYWDFTDATQDDLAVIQSMTVETYEEGRGEGARTVKKFKVDIADATGALNAIARRLGLFNDKVTVTGEVSLIERLQRGRARAKADNKE